MTPSTPPHPSFEQTLDDIFSRSNLVADKEMGRFYMTDFRPEYRGESEVQAAILAAHNQAVAQAVREELEGLYNAYRTTTGLKTKDWDAQDPFSLVMKERIAALEGEQANKD